VVTFKWQAQSESKESAYLDMLCCVWSSCCATFNHYVVLHHFDFWLQAYKEQWVFCLSHQLSVRRHFRLLNNNEGAKPALLCGAERSSAPRNGGGFGGKV